ncbi:hypothetical protein J6590_054001 [Homalodisca vitripennis]|nr:hypothetical protein J6590_054001 [Homalodisca vitripennis]
MKRPAPGLREGGGIVHAMKRGLAPMIQLMVSLGLKWRHANSADSKDVHSEGVQGCDNIITILQCILMTRTIEGPEWFRHRPSPSCHKWLCARLRAPTRVIAHLRYAVLNVWDHTDEPERSATRLKIMEFTHKDMCSPAPACSVSCESPPGEWQGHGRLSPHHPCRTWAAELHKDNGIYHGDRGSFVGTCRSKSNLEDKNRAENKAQGCLAPVATKRGTPRVRRRLGHPVSVTVYRVTIGWTSGLHNNIMRSTAQCLSSLQLVNSSKGHVRTTDNSLELIDKKPRSCRRVSGYTIRIKESEVGRYLQDRNPWGAENRGRKPCFINRTSGHAARRRGALAFKYLRAGSEKRISKTDPEDERGNFRGTNARAGRAGGDRTRLGGWGGRGVDNSCIFILGMCAGKNGCWRNIINLLQDKCVGHFARRGFFVCPGLTIHSNRGIMRGNRRTGSGLYPGVCSKNCHLGDCR